jgi:ketosteroid isomerase-like protein
MLTKEAVVKFAEDWISAWNSHDLDRIMAHYADHVELVSPVAEQLVGKPGGRVSGKVELKNYFMKGLEAYPNLQFVLKDILLGVSGIVLYYRNQKGTHTGEFMELSPQGKITKVVANYSA